MMLNIWGKLFTVLLNISAIFIIRYFKVSSSLGSPVSYSSVEESWYSKLQTLFIFDQSAVKWNFSVSLNGILCTDVLFTPCSSFSFRLPWGVYRNERSAVSCSFVSCSHPLWSPDPMNKWQQKKKYFDDGNKWKRGIYLYFFLCESRSLTNILIGLQLNLLFLIYKCPHIVRRLIQ